MSSSTPESTIINVTTIDLISEAELQFIISKFNQMSEADFQKYLASKRCLRWAMTRVWNKEGAFRLMTIFEYKDEKSSLKCQEYFNQVEDKSNEQPLKLISNRAVIVSEYRA